MKTLLRCGYLALIAAFVAIQLTHGQRANAEADPMATVAAGLARLNVRTDPPAAPDILTGRWSSCAEPVQVVLLRMDGAEDDRLRGPGLEDRAVKYVFLGSVSETRNNFAITSRWARASILFALGLRSDRPRSNLVVVILPRGCPGLASLDWAALSPLD